MPRLSSRSARALTATLAATALIGLPAARGLALNGVHEEVADALAPTELAPVLPVPFTSPNVNHLQNVPLPGLISGVFSPSAPYFYVSSVHSITVFDVSDPKLPKVVGVLDNLEFENEAMNYGERRNSAGKVVMRFVLVGVDLYQASSSDPQHTSATDGRKLVKVVDVTDPTNPHIVGSTRATTSTHTVSCVQVRNCRTAYTAGSNVKSTDAPDGRGYYSMINLTDPKNPSEVDADKHVAGVQPFRSPASGPGGPLKAGHKWNFDNAGYGFHTGGAGTAVFDVSRPRHPRLVTTTGKQGVEPGWNDFIHHNSERPNARAFKPYSTPRVQHGNVLLITEEDYEQTDCSKAGSFQTWKIKTLNGTPSAVVHLDKINPVTAENGTPFPVPQDAFCSAHWFDYHPAGIVALATYAGGLRLIDVRHPRNLSQYGYAFGGLSEVWDAYWAPKRDAAGRAIGSSSIVYTVDFVRGLDVYHVALPQEGPTGPS